jgi:hypothetical protein
MTSEHDQDGHPREGGENREGRPAGTTESTRPGAEGRPSEVRHADAARKSDPENAPTEDVVDRGGTPSTEHQPGGDL